MEKIYLAGGMNSKEPEIRHYQCVIRATRRRKPAIPDSIVLLWAVLGGHPAPAVSEALKREKDARAAERECPLDK